MLKVMLLQHHYLRNMHSIGLLRIRRRVNVDAPHCGMHGHYEKLTAAFIGRIQRETKVCLDLKHDVRKGRTDTFEAWSARPTTFPFTR